MRDKWFWLLELCSFGLVLYVGYITGRNVEVRETFGARGDHLLLLDSIVNIRPDPRDCDEGVIKVTPNTKFIARIHC